MFHNRSLRTRRRYQSGRIRAYELINQTKPNQTCFIPSITVQLPPFSLHSQSSNSNERCKPSTQVHKVASLSSLITPLFKSLVDEDCARYSMLQILLVLLNCNSAVTRLLLNCYSAFTQLCCYSTQLCFGSYPSYFRGRDVKL